MSDQTSIFGEQNTQATPAPSGTSTPNPSQSSTTPQDLLLLIKNDKGEPKYKTVEAALEGLMHAQNHIHTLLTEKQQVEVELNTLRPVASKVSELEKVVDALTRSAPAKVDTPQPKGLSEEDVAKLVEQTMTASQQKAIQTQNLASVVNSVKTAFGTDAEKVFYQKAEELGMSQAEVNALAARTPAAVLRMLGIEAKPSTAGSGTTVGTINTTSLEPNKETKIGRNKKTLPIGATHRELMSEAQEAKDMVTEMNAQGMSIDDLTKPSNFFKYLGQ